MGAQRRRTCQGDPLARAAVREIVARVREALERLEGGEVRSASQCETLLREALDRVRGWRASRAARGLEPACMPARGLRCVVAAGGAGEPVSEFLLIPFGEVKLERPLAGGSFVFTRRHAESALRWFERLGRKLAIDYEHQSFDGLNRREDGLRPAAGWIGGLEIRDDGLWATRVTWTERARELLRRGEYRYFSPVIYWTDADYSDVAALGPVALTNDPAMHGAVALAAGRAGPTCEVPAPAARDADETGPGPSCAEEVSRCSASGPGTQAGAGEESDASAGVVTEDVSSPGDGSLGVLYAGELVPRAELQAAEAEIALLRRKLAVQEADTFVERGMRLGKILDSTSMDWHADYLRDPQQAEERLARAPVLLPPGRVVKLDRSGRVEPLGALLLRRMGEKPRLQGIEPEDLAAFEQALAAGRVRVG